MAFSDPQSITIGASTASLPRTGSGPNSGTFTSPTGELKLTISHAVNKRARRTARIDIQKIVPDPLLPAVNAPRSASVYLVCDAPLTGFTGAELTDGIVAICDYLSASSGAAAARLLGGES